MLLGSKKILKKENISKKILERVIFNINDIDTQNSLEEYMPLSQAESRIYENITILMDKESTNHLTFYRVKSKMSEDKVMLSLKSINEVLPYLTKTELGYVQMNLQNFFSKNSSAYFTDKQLDDEIRSIAEFLNKNQDDEDFLMISKHLCLNEKLVNDLIANYQFCSYGNQIFTSLMLLLITKSTIELTIK